MQEAGTVATTAPRHPTGEITLPAQHRLTPVHSLVPITRTTRLVLMDITVAIAEVLKIAQVRHIIVLKHE